MMKPYNEPSIQSIDHEKLTSKKRLVIVFCIFITSFSLLIYRAIYLHLAPDQKLQRLVSRQYNQVVKEAPPRGNIYDTNEERLAISIPSYSLAAHPHQVDNPQQLSAFLSRTLKLSQKELLIKLKSHKKFVWIKRRLDPKEYEIVHGQSLTGIEFVNETRRFYPNRELASQVLGAVGHDNEGLSGLELYYDHFLRSQDPDKLAYRDAKGRIFEKNLDPLKESTHSLGLTIDKTIQYVAETELTKVSKKWQAQRGMAIVMDPRTGAILAMASYPPFNPNSYPEYELNQWRNLPITDTFEPGSIFKAMVAAAALESKAVNPDDVFFCENGSFEIGKMEIHDHKKYGDLTFRDIIRVSSNIGIYKVSRSVGKKYFYNILRDFSFGDAVGIDFPGEVSGQLRHADAWQEIDRANIAFGQGVNVTLLQIASAFSVIANGGLLWKPYIVKEIKNDVGDVVFSRKPILVRRVIREETADTMRHLLHGVVKADGTGAEAIVPGYEVAGKTGTAQKFDWNLHAYSDEKYATSFVGFLPFDHPQFVIAISIDEPKGLVYGGTVAAPAFRRMASAIVQHLKIPPQQIRVPVIEVRGSPPPALSDNIARIAKINQEGFSVPNLQGMTVREVLSLLEGQDISVAIEGTGIAFQQEPGPGQLIKSGGMCRVYFRPRT